MRNLLVHLVVLDLVVLDVVMLVAINYELLYCIVYCMYGTCA